MEGRSLLHLPDFTGIKGDPHIMSMITPEKPGPFLLPKTPGLRDQSLCLDTKRAVTTYLFTGEQVGEPTLLITHDIVEPFVRAWKASADQVALQGYEDRLKHNIDFDDPIFRDIKQMTDRATFYVNTLAEVRGEGLEEQRRVLLGYVVNPLFRGVRYKTYFDENSGVIDVGSDYCTPMRIASQLGYAVNVYRELTGITLPDTLRAVYQAHEDVTQDWMVSAFGPAEKYQRMFEEDLAPVLANAKDAAHAATHVLVTVAKASRPNVLLFGLAAAAGVYLLTRKR